MADYSGKFVSDLIRCFDNKKSFIVLEFDRGEFLEICVGPNHNFNEGKVLKIDNAGDTLSISYGADLELRKRETVFNLGADRYPTNPEPEFFLGTHERTPIRKLEHQQIMEILALRSCVEDGDFFIEIYDTPTPRVHTVLGSK